MPFFNVIHRSNAVAHEDRHQGSVELSLGNGRSSTTHAENLRVFIRRDFGANRIFRFRGAQLLCRRRAVVTGTVIRIGDCPATWGPGHGDCENAQMAVSGGVSRLDPSCSLCNQTTSSDRVRRLRGYLVKSMSFANFRDHITRIRSECRGHSFDA